MALEPTSAVCCRLRGCEHVHMLREPRCLLLAGTFSAPLQQSFADKRASDQIYWPLTSTGHQLIHRSRAKAMSDTLATFLTLLDDILLTCVHKQATPASCEVVRTAAESCSSGSSHAKRCRLPTTVPQSGCSVSQRLERCETCQRRWLPSTRSASLPTSWP